MVARPAVGHERVEPAPRLLGDIRFMERPRVVAAQFTRALDEQDGRLPADKPQPTADNPWPSPSEFLRKAGHYGGAVGSGGMCGKIIMHRGTWHGGPESMLLYCMLAGGTS